MIGDINESVNDAIGGWQDNPFCGKLLELSKAPMFLDGDVHQNEAAVACIGETTSPSDATENGEDACIGPSDWTVPQCTFTSGNNNKCLQTLRQLSEPWPIFQFGFAPRNKPESGFSRKSRPAVNSDQFAHKRQDKEFELGPWSLAHESETLSALASRRHAGCYEMSQYKRRSHVSRKNPLHKTFKFQHLPDFKEYIQQYRENHAQTIILKDRLERIANSRTTSLERVPAQSSVAEVTDLSSLVSEVPIRKPETPRLKLLTSGGQVSDTPRKMYESNSHFMESFMETGRGSFREKYGCSKGLTVYRRGVSLSPAKKYLSSELTISTVQRLSLRVRKRLDPTVAAPKPLGTNGSGKYLNLKSPCTGPTKQVDSKQSKKGDCVTASSLGGLSLDCRKEMTETETEEQTGRDGSLKNETEKCRPSESKSVVMEDVGKGTISGGRYIAGYGKDFNPGTLYLGYCLAQLSTSRDEHKPDSENTFTNKMTPTYELTGHQLRGRTPTPRDGPITPARSNKMADVKTVSKTPHLGISSARQEKNVKLGIKGSNLNCNRECIPTSSTPLGIFDMPV